MHFLYLFKYHALEDLILDSFQLLKDYSIKILSYLEQGYVEFFWEKKMLPLSKLSSLEIAQMLHLRSPQICYELHFWQKLALQLRINGCVLFYPIIGL